MKRLLVLMLALPLMAAGCLGSSGTTPAPAPAQPAPAPQAAPTPKPGALVPKPQTFAVTITATAFAPQVEAIHTGDTVIWTNKSKTSQTVRGAGGAPLWDSGNIQPGGTFTRTFTSPGTYDYISASHPTSTGSIVVTDYPVR